MTEETKKWLPCKWMRPSRDVFVACWNYDKVESILGERVSGNLPLEYRDYCRGDGDDIPECWEGLQQRCIDQCEYYFTGTSKYNKLKGFCTKECKNFEHFKPKKEYENAYKDFDDLDILDILKLPEKKL